ncbi:MAG TPA: DUF6587 family protein [Arenimonas sp.]|nr:DUF6587 family protein [Arenimonas sp.]
MALALQYLLVAAAVLVSAVYVLANRAPHFTRRCRVAFALSLVAASRPPWLRALGRWIAPPPSAGACGGCSDACHRG